MTYAQVVSMPAPPPSGATPDLADGEWTERFRAGDDLALREAFDRYGGMVQRVGILRLGNHHDAEELVQQVFVRAWKGREGFDPERGALVVVPISGGKRGNPVVWSRRFFQELMTLDGDVGARHLIAKHSEAVAEVAVEEAAPDPLAASASAGEAA